LEILRIPIDGGAPSPTGIFESFRSIGVEEPQIKGIFGDRLLAVGNSDGRTASFAVQLDPGTGRTTGSPQRLAVGTEDQVIGNVSRDGTAVLRSGRSSADLYLLPMDPQTGDVAGPARRLTADGRAKETVEVSGDPGLVYFREGGPSGNKLHSLDLKTGAQAYVADTPLGAAVIVSVDGKSVAQSNNAGDISIGLAGGRPETLRPLCKKCGAPRLFSPDGEYVVVSTSTGPGARRSLRLVKVATGESTPWIEDPVESVSTFDYFAGTGWLSINTRMPGDPSGGGAGRFAIQWRIPASPRSDWIEIPLPTKVGWNLSPGSPFIYGTLSRDPYSVRFDPKTGRFGKLFPLHLNQGPQGFQPGDGFGLRGPGFVLTRRSITGSIWTMKLPGLGAN
jgi:hypothetical protein